MKKFLAIAASAVMALGVVPFAACGGKEDESAANLKYTEVDLSSEQKKSAFIEEVASKINPDTMFGDANDKNLTVGLASDIKYGFDVNANIGGMELSAKMDYSGDTKVKVSEESALAESTSTVKLNSEIPAELYAMAEMPAEVIPMVDALISNFDCTIKEYIDGEYVYAALPQSYLDALPAEAQGMFPESGKIKFPLEMSGSYDAPIEGYTAKSVAVESQTAAIVAGVMEMLIEANVKVETSTQNGYAIKVSAGKDAIINLIGEMTDSSTAAMINFYATFNTCDITAYLAVDNNGMFKEVGITLNLDVALNIPQSEESPAITAAIKANVDMNVKTFNGNITLPTDLNTYVDMMAMMA